MPPGGGTGFLAWAGPVDGGSGGGVQAGGAEVGSLSGLVTAVYAGAGEAAGAGVTQFRVGVAEVLVDAVGAAGQDDGGGAVVLQPDFCDRLDLVGGGWVAGPRGGWSGHEGDRR